MEHFDGKCKQGPFAKLLEIGQQLSWQMDAPFIRDRHGTQIDWLNVEDKTMNHLLQEAWTWKIWEDMHARKDFDGLYGIDRRVVQEAGKQLQPHQKSTIHVLQDGTFVEAKTHAKYDLTKDGTCPLCKGNDSLEHRCTSCPALMETYAGHEATLNRWATWSPAKKLHLLPSANPHLCRFRKLLMETEGNVERRSFTCSEECLHLFTDGSCMNGKIPEYSLGSWAVVAPCCDQWVMRGSLGGPIQSADRAELRAIIAAVETGLQMDKPLVIWSDSSYAGEGLTRLLLNIHDIPDTSNTEDWLELHGLLLGHEHEIRVQHVPGHSTTAWQDNDIQEWIARWNDRADREAQGAQKLHGETLLCQQTLWKHHEQEVRDLCDLQNLHLEISHQFATLDELAHQPDEDTYEDGECDPVDLMVERGCPESPNPFTGLQLDNADARMKLEQKFGGVFSRWMLNWIHSLEDADDLRLCKISFLEIAVFVMKEGKDSLPRVDTTNSNCWCDSGTVGSVEPTLGALLRLVKAFLQTLEHCFSLAFTRWQGINLVSAGVHTPLPGLTFPVTDGFSQTVRQGLLIFTSARPIRTVNDLSRPLRRWASLSYRLSLANACGIVTNQSPRVNWMGNWQQYIDGKNVFWSFRNPKLSQNQAGSLFVVCT